MAASNLAMYSPTDYTIRHTKNNDETRRLWWPNMVEVQWNRGPADLATYMDHSESGGMLLAFQKDHAPPVGHVAAVINDKACGWVSMFIVKAEYRGLKLGAALWDAMMADFRKAGTEYIGLDGVPEQKATYERRGFVESKLGMIKFMTLPLSQGVAAPSTKSWSIMEVDTDLLARYEEKYTGFHRPAMWKEFVRREDVCGAVSASKKPESLEDITGFATIRRAPNGVRLSPVYADTASIASELVAAMVTASTPSYIRSHPMVDYPLHELDDAAMCDKAFTCVEMWSGNTASEQVFAGWTELALFHRMWLNNKAIPQQSEGGSASRGLFAIFDAAIG